MATLLSDSPGDGRPSHIPANNSTGLGELLRRAREDRGLTLEQISNETKIPQRHLEALERDNLAAVPGGFYQRAEIRAYARTVHLDQNLALEQLERALEPSMAREAMPEISGTGTEEPLLSRTRLLIVIGVVVAAAVFGRVMGSREPALSGEAQPQSTTAPPQRAPAVPGTPDAAAGTFQHEQSKPFVPLSVPSEGAPEVASPRASAASITEVVVTTQPAGARVTVNGIGWGNAPVTIRYLPPGDKRIRVSMDGYIAVERLVRLAEGQPRALDIRLESAR